MDATQFDSLTHTLTLTPTRRDVTRALAGLALGGATTAMMKADAGAKNKKKCGPCQTKKHGKCKPKPNEAACNGDGACFAGTCIPRPTCQAAYTPCLGQDAVCCSGYCKAEMGCFFSGPGQSCYGDSDCEPFGEPLSCIAYRCRP